MLHKLEELQKSTPEGFLKFELQEAVAAVYDTMPEQEIVETVLTEITRQRNLKRDEYCAGKMEAIING